MSRDCLSRLCLLGACAPLSCVNLRLDGDETDFDCGGPVCVRCAVGARCLVDRDCRLGLACVAGRCR